MNSRFALVAVTVGLLTAACSQTPTQSGDNNGNPNTTAALTIDGTSAKNAAGATWYGNGDVTIKAPPSIGGKAVNSLDVTVGGSAGIKTANGSTLTGSQTISTTGLTLPRASNPGTYPGTTLTITSINYADGSKGTPPAGSAALSLNLDNQGPTLNWNDSDSSGYNRKRRYRTGCTDPGNTAPNNYDGIGQKAQPGEQLDWRYLVNDAGSGVNRVEHYNLIVRNDNGDFTTFEQKAWFEIGEDPSESFDNKSGTTPLGGKMTFTQLGKGANFRAVAYDALGNSAQDWDPYNPPVLPSQSQIDDVVCVGYELNTNGFVMSKVTGFTLSPSTAARGASVTASAATDPGAGQTILETRYFARPAGSEAVFRYVGKASGATTLASTGFTKTAGSTEIAAVAINGVHNAGMRYSGADNAPSLTVTP